MDNIIEILEERSFECLGCKKQGSCKTFVLRESKPHKLFTARNCPHCGTTETTEDDYELLDYAIKITCTFIDSKDSFGRMVFINTNAETYFYDLDSNQKFNEIFSFVADRGNVDYIEGLILRGRDALTAASEDGIKDVVDRFDNAFKNRCLKIIIVDNSGYSRVCPIGKEYNSVIDMDLNQLNSINDDVFHEKIEK